MDKKKIFMLGYLGFFAASIGVVNVYVPYYSQAAKDARERFQNSRPEPASKE